MDGWRLTARQREELERRLHRTCDARVYRRAVAILEVSEGVPVQAVGRTLGVSRQSIYNWMAQYGSVEGRASLADQPRSGRPQLWTEERGAWLRGLMQLSPEARGYFANSWTVPLLREELFHCTGLEVSDDTIRRGLSRLGYVWKRSRYALLPDPEREKKTPNLPGNSPSAAADCAARGR